MSTLNNETTDLFKSDLTIPHREADWDGREALALAIRFHDAYERLAPSFGYETRTETRLFDPETPNGKLMVAVCRELRVIDPALRERFEDLVLDPLWVQLGNQGPGYKAAMDVFRLVLGKAQPACSKPTVTTDQSPADAQAMHFLETRAAKALETTPNVEVRWEDFQGCGRAGSLWIEGRLTATTLVLRNDFNNSVFVSHEY